MPNFETTPIPYVPIADKAAEVRTAVGLAPDTTGNTNLNAILAAGPAASRDAIKAQSSGIGFSDRFERRTDGDRILHNVTTPENGGVWQVHTTPGGADSAPVIENGMLRAADNQLSYLGSSVACPDGKIVITLEMILVGDGTPSAFTDGLPNVSFSNTQMIQSDGLTVFPEGVVHINATRLGVGATIYSNTPEDVVFLQAEEVADGESARWLNNSARLPANHRFIIRYEAEGDRLRISAMGKTFNYKNAALSGKVAATTYFWVEPGHSTTLGVNAYIKSIAVNAPELDTSARYTNEDPMPLIKTLGFHEPGYQTILPHALRLWPTGAKLGDGFIPAGVQNYIAGTSTTDKGSGKLRINGGHHFAEGGYLSHIGMAGVATGVFTRAAMDYDLGLDSALTSIATTESTLKTVTPTSSLENGDMEVLEFCGNLVGTNAKRIRLIRTASGATFFDSDAAGTPLTAVTGPWNLVIRRNVTAANSFINAVFTANGVSIVQRLAVNLGNVYFPLDFKTTTVDAGGVSLEYARQQLVRVNIN